MIHLEQGQNLGKTWPWEFRVQVKLQDPTNGRFLKDDLADYQRGRRRLWEQKSER